MDEIPRSRGWRMSWTPFAALPLFLGAIACGHGDSTGFARYAGGVNGDSAMIGGQLVREGNCLYALHSDDGSRTLLALPDTGVAWDDKEQVLSLSNNFDGSKRTVDYRVGANFTIGGSRATDPASISWTTRPDSSCDTTNVALVGFQ